jgi:hypothetical protein
MLVHVSDLPTLQLGVQGQRAEPRLRGIPTLPDRRAGVAEKQPRALLVVRDHLCNTVRPAREELRCEPGLEGLDGRARLEPGHPA